MITINKFMENVVLLEKRLKKCKKQYKDILRDVEIKSIDGYKINIQSEGYIYISAMDLSSTAIYFTYDNQPTSNPNNLFEKDNNSYNYFYRMSTDNDFIIVRNPKDDSTYQVLIPRFNDNEDEIMFTTNLVVSNALPIVLSSILLTMDTNICTLYVSNITPEMLDTLNELIIETNTCITNYIQKLSKP